MDWKIVWLTPALIWTFTIIGTASLIVGGILLLMGLMKYRKQQKEKLYGKA